MTEDEKRTESKPNDDDYPANFDTLPDDEKIDIVAAKILKRHKQAFIELAK